MQNTNKHPYTLLTALNFRFRMLCAWKTRREGIQPSKQSLQVSWAKSWLHTSPDFPLFSKPLTVCMLNFHFDSVSWFFLNSDFHIFVLCSAFGLGPGQTPRLCCTPGPDSFIGVWTGLVKTTTLISTWATQFLLSQVTKCYQVKVLLKVKGGFKCYLWHTLVV